MILPAFLGCAQRKRRNRIQRDIHVRASHQRERLIAILVLGNKRSGRYSLEEMGVIEDVTSRVAVSLEKEYLREQLREREEELSVINNSSFILSSSMGIQEIFGSFIEELRTVIDVEWAAIVLLDEDDLYFAAISSTEDSAYKIGDKIPTDGTGTGWVISHNKVFVESDLSQSRYFPAAKNISGAVCVPRSTSFADQRTRLRQPDYYQQASERLQPAPYQAAGAAFLADRHASREQPALREGGKEGPHRRANRAAEPPLPGRNDR